jgi:hypothetical protein
LTTGDYFAEAAAALAKELSRKGPVVLKISARNGYGHLKNRPYTKLAVTFGLGFLFARMR